MTPHDSALAALLVAQPRVEGGEVVHGEADLRSPALHQRDGVRGGGAHAALDQRGAHHCRASADTVADLFYLTCGGSCTHGFPHNSSTRNGSLEVP
eukprot:TRINITY_DN1164_c0_g1_i1.p1 TRINITY_DN1164_c0_g1~~TRINITY_DN1164_c0_g1_i1.p1  ORF type:complete len:108 (-),score=8.11 TRINITY_DN1164_c0_g1_i1:41-328(-)